MLGKFGKKAVRVCFAVSACAAVLVPFKNMFKAYGFYRSFVFAGELAYGAGGEPEYIYTDSVKNTHLLPLKYADRLEFDAKKKTEVKLDRTEDNQLRYDVTNIEPHSVVLADTACLLKHIGGEWYIVERFSDGFPAAYGYPYGRREIGAANSPGLYHCGETKSRWYPLFFHDGGQGASQALSYEDGRSFYTLPSGRYALFVPADEPAEEDGVLVGRGSALVEFELINLAGKSECFRFEQLESGREHYMTGEGENPLPAPGREYGGHPFAFGSYRIENVGETLYKDPYEK